MRKEKYNKKTLRKKYKKNDENVVPINKKKKTSYAN